MAVVSVYESWEGRQGSNSFTRHRTYTRTFEVYTDDPFDGPVAATDTVLLPRIGDRHPEDIGAVVVGFRPVQDSADPHRWIVAVEYDTQPEFPEAVQPTAEAAAEAAAETTEPGETPENPLARPAVWKWSFQQTTEVARLALEIGADDRPTGNSKVIRNSAKLPFDPPVMIEVSRPILTLTVNRPFFDTQRAIDLVDSVNDRAWWRCTPRQARCIGIDAQSAFENNVHFWVLTYTFAFKQDTWDVRTLDAGFAELTGANQWQKVLDAFGQPVTEPVPLNGSGAKLTPGDPEVYLRWRVYRERDFGALIH